MYVCAECGDLGCGAVTAAVEVGDDKVVWRDFGYQNNYEPKEVAARLLFLDSVKLLRGGCAAKGVLP
jgi:hypothetical protein